MHLLIESMRLKIARTDAESLALVDVMHFCTCDAESLALVDVSDDAELALVEMHLLTLSRLRFTDVESDALVDLKDALVD
jgi:hypothetical protein